MVVWGLFKQPRGMAKKSLLSAWFQAWFYFFILYLLLSINARFWWRSRKDVGPANFVAAGRSMQLCVRSERATNAHALPMPRSPRQC